MALLLLSLPPSLPFLPLPPLLTFTDINHYNSLLQRIDIESVLDVESPSIKDDIIKMIVQYLRQEGLTQSCVTLQDESLVKVARSQVSNQDQDQDQDKG